MRLLCTSRAARGVAQHRLRKPERLRAATELEHHGCCALEPRRTSSAQHSRDTPHWMSRPDLRMSLNMTLSQPRCRPAPRPLRALDRNIRSIVIVHDAIATADHHPVVFAVVWGRSPSACDGDTLGRFRRPLRQAGAMRSVARRQQSPSCVIYEPATDRRQGATRFAARQPQPRHSRPSFATVTLIVGVSLQTTMQ